MQLKTLQEMIHQNAVDHGWWEDGERPFPEIIALCHAELSEALEEYRDNKPMEYTVCAGCQYNTSERNCVLSDCPHYAMKDKPEGMAVEVADAIIRMLDWAEGAGIDMEAVILRKHAYNVTRPYRHGGKVA